MSGASHTKLLPEHYSAPYGSPEALENLGTSAAPLLAGFAFALIGLLFDKGNVIWKPDLAMLLLVIAGLLLIAAVQFGFNARRFHVPPGDYIAFLDIAKEDGFSPQLGELQAEWRGIHAEWATRTRYAYNAGVTVLLAGVATVLVPATGPGHMAPLRAAAVLVAAVGALGELAWWLVLPWWRRRQQLKKIVAEPVVSVPATPEVTSRPKQRK